MSEAYISRFGSFRRGNAQRPLVYGHRGARHAAPENTMAAFELAAREGADGIELDVRLDGDGRVIVLHDRSLSRVSGGRSTALAARLTARELAGIDVGAGERVPALRDALAWAARQNLRLNVELKHDVPDIRRLVRGVVELTRATPDAPERVLLSCFHPRVVRELARALPDVAVAWLVHAGQRFFQHAPGLGWLGASAVHPEWRITDSSKVCRWQRGNAIVNVWTVNDEAEAARLSALGVDGLISDRPGAILDALAVRTQVAAS